VHDAEGPSDSQVNIIPQAPPQGGLRKGWGGGGTSMPEARTRTGVRCADARPSARGYGWRKRWGDGGWECTACWSAMA